MSSRAWLPAALLALGGCTLIMQGTTQELNFTSEPAGAVFSVGGQTYTTPALKVEVPKEDYTVVFRRPGYKEYPVELKRQTSSYFYWSLVMGLIAAGIDMITGAWQEFQTTDVHVILEPLPDTPVEIAVSVSSDPPGAQVFVGETLHGRTPADLRLLWVSREQQKDVTFRLPGYKPRTLPLGRAESRLRAVLEPEPVAVKVYVTSRPAGADVRLSGRLVGKTPLPVDVVWLPRDPPRKLEVSKEGYRAVAAELRGPEDKEVAAELSEIVEELPLRLNVIPAGADVEVDGAPAAAGTKDLRLRWSVTLRNHTLRISHPGYLPATVDVTRAKAEGVLEVRLVPSLPKAP